MPAVMARGPARQHLIAGGPVAQPLGQLMESLRRYTASETADRVGGADGPMGGGGPEPRRQAWHPLLQHRLPGRFRQFAVEEGDPIGNAASVAQGRLPISR